MTQQYRLELSGESTDQTFGSPHAQPERYTDICIAW